MIKDKFQDRIYTEFCQGVYRKTVTVPEYKIDSDGKITKK
jgi:hypothetical protein